MNRYREACDMILEEIRSIKRVNPEGAHWLYRIEQILTLTESRIQDDLEEQHKAYLADQGKDEEPWHHV